MGPGFESQRDHEKLNNKEEDRLKCRFQAVFAFMSHLVWIGPEQRFRPVIWFTAGVFNFKNRKVLCKVLFRERLGYWKNNDTRETHIDRESRVFNSFLDDHSCGKNGIENFCVCIILIKTQLDSNLQADKLAVLGICLFHSQKITDHRLIPFAWV